MPKDGDKRYFAEYLDYAQGCKLMRADGGDPDYDTMWDYCSQDDIDTTKPFPTKEAAMEWANENHKLDVFHMPRIREDTYVVRPADDRHLPTTGWEQSGYWEMDGETVIEEYVD